MELHPKLGSSSRRGSLDCKPQISLTPDGSEYRTPRRSVSCVENVIAELSPILGGSGLSYRSGSALCFTSSPPPSVCDSRKPSTCDSTYSRRSSSNVPTISITPDTSLNVTPRSSIGQHEGHYVDMITNLKGSFLSLNVPQIHLKPVGIERSSSADILRSVCLEIKQHKTGNKVSVFPICPDDSPLVA